MFAMKLVTTGAASFAGALMVGVIATTGREVKKSGEDVVKLEQAVDSLRVALAQTMPARGFGKGRPDVETDFNEDVDNPVVDASSFIDPLGSVVGSVHLGKQVYVAPFASIRGDEGQPIFIGDGSNVQDGAVVHALETAQEGKPIPNRTYNVSGREYAVYIGKRVSVAHQALVHGPARVDDNVCVGEELHRVGAALTAIRRLGIEYLEGISTPTPADIVWWLEALIGALGTHPAWERLEMLSELDRLAKELATRVRES